MNYNSLNAPLQAWGGLSIIVVLVGLVATGAWGPLAFIAVGVPIVGYIETHNR